ncbi:OLC1v1008017C1 [Oldenlandia corymbosa var. corymbosa]|uniref:OLC1v1008017C1 n=1 Tax=Oldenlandia corymbosa var. corymbosa TaxID=529605 RepID=A0AAV1DP10_OLDCO|nr:OLC1v1008017C1 [Oldenlandia corymbosa var. corymbosa]
MTATSFSSTSTLICILNLRQPIYEFDRRPFIVKDWVVIEELKINEIKTVPVWIQLPKLPLRYCSESILSKLASMIVKPIEMNDMTVNKQRTAFARVLVEVDIRDTVKESIWCEDEHGELKEQQVRYEWKPMKCLNCKGFGHTTKDCRLPVVKDWKKKEGNVVDESKMQLSDGSQRNEKMLEEHRSPMQADLVFSRHVSSPTPASGVRRPFRILKRGQSPDNIEGIQN